MYNDFLKKNSYVLNSHNNFQKDKALFFKKMKILNQIFCLDNGFQASKLCSNFLFWKLCHFKSSLGFDRMFSNDFILHFWVGRKEFFQNIYSFICVTSTSTKILEIKNAKIFVKSKFLSFFPFWKPDCHKSLCLNSLNFAFWWSFYSILSGFVHCIIFNKPFTNTNTS